MLPPRVPSMPWTPGTTVQHSLFMPTGEAGKRMEENWPRGAYPLKLHLELAKACKPNNGAHHCHHSSCPAPSFIFLLEQCPIYSMTEKAKKPARSWPFSEHCPGDALCAHLPGSHALYSHPLLVPLLVSWEVCSQFQTLAHRSVLPGLWTKAAEPRGLPGHFLQGNALSHLPEVWPPPGSLCRTRPHLIGSVGARC